MFRADWFREKLEVSYSPSSTFLFALAPCPLASCTPPPSLPPLPTTCGLIFRHRSGAMAMSGADAIVEVSSVS